MPDRFWRGYVARHPLDRPASLRKPLGSPLVTPSEIWDALVAAADLVRRHVRCELRVYLGDRAMVRRQTFDQLGERFWDVLPELGDGSLAGYGERLKSRHGYECFAVILNESQRVVPAIWARVRDFLRELYEETGFPMAGADANVFAGNYRRTPFGVHTDERDVFTAIIEGQKKFLVWPRDTFPPEVQGGGSEAHDYEAFRDRATRLEGGAGDLLYWPKSHWHVAESAGDAPATTLSIGLAHRLDGESWIRDAVSSPHLPADPSDDTMTHHPFDDAAIDRSVRALPKPLASALKAARAKTASDAVDAQLRLRWLCHVTAFGLEVPPRAQIADVTDDDVVRCDPRYPIRCVAWRKVLLCSANGYGFSTPRRASIVKLVQELDTGRDLRVGDLCQRFAKRLPPAHVRTLVRTFLAYRALERT